MKAKDFLSDNGFASHKGRRTAEEINALNEAIKQYGNIFEDYEYRKPKDVQVLKAPSIASSVAYRRNENTIRVVDKLTGATINTDMCFNGHSVRRCSCKEVQPTKFLMDIAESWSLVVR